eukprot:TRINITY_DN6746_c0_g1_i2.p1 TRINITY_DN6746_c0_g1~~TRINITY_DN6746_c0_g1_i2.p1  ORF type:complete len:518 (+),score=77.61 TRINITY_DN6746_c0_g1_i2:169-1722(+)
MEQYLSLQSLRPRLNSTPGGAQGGSSSQANSPRFRPLAWVRFAKIAWNSLQQKPPSTLIAMGGGLLLLLLLVLSSSRGKGSVQVNLSGGSGHSGNLSSHPCAPTNGAVSLRVLHQVRPFIYMYDFGTEYTSDVRKCSPAFYSEVYDAEKQFYEFMVSPAGEAFRTSSPASAALFYVPFFSAYHTSCAYRDAEVNMKAAVAQTSEVWSGLLQRVRRDFPHFNRSNGADHFSVLSFDHGRCTALTFVNPVAYGEMFFLQHNGDKMVRSAHAHSARNLQVLTYNYGAQLDTDVPDIPCYRSDRDILIPAIVDGQLNVAIRLDGDANVAQRSVQAVFHFRDSHHHSQPVFHEQHLIRKELFQLYENKVVGWLFGPAASEQRMIRDFRQAVFCVCPPGHSQWTTRPIKALLAGCIPVTFYRDHDNPWQDEVNYLEFSVNVDPDQLPSLQSRLAALASDGPHLQAMQRKIAALRPQFQWNASSPLGVEHSSLRRLLQRALTLRAAGRLDHQAAAALQSAVGAA